MPHRRRGQSLVEMAFVLPVLLIVLFGIVEFGYYIYAYSTVSQAARNGAEVAAQLPPEPSWLIEGNRGGIAIDDDKCVGSIYNAINSDATLFSGETGTNGHRGIDSDDYITITYPDGAGTRNLDDRGPIEVTVRYPVRGLTPLFQLLRINGGSGEVWLQVTQRRSLENLGVDPSTPRGLACAKDAADWQEINQ